METGMYEADTKDCLVSRLKKTKRLAAHRSTPSVGKSSAQWNSTKRTSPSSARSFKHPLSAKDGCCAILPQTELPPRGSTTYEPPLVLELLTGLRSPASVPSLRNCVWQRALSLLSETLRLGRDFDENVTIKISQKLLEKIQKTTICGPDPAKYPVSGSSPSKPPINGHIPAKHPVIEVIKSNPAKHPVSRSNLQNTQSMDPILQSTQSVDPILQIPSNEPNPANPQSMDPILQSSQSVDLIIAGDRPRSKPHVLDFPDIYDLLKDLIRPSAGFF
ncbi:hypothetical protein CEXT_691801 [Caerostris extrusa]|uniref:Uncharacterized protein n=1 Tax=Caerostris extrusa TaxID=172846 RepID=A0AAV4VHQ9_CAEEX|nr:hypothetical protein CEXT_691801 [Caerostris extrusa]